MKRLVILALLFFGSPFAKAQLVRFSVQLFSRGHANLSPEQLRHFVPFDTTPLLTGVKAVDIVHEIAADDIQAAAEVFSVPALVFISKPR